METLESNISFYKTGGTIGRLYFLLNNLIIIVIFIIVYIFLHFLLHEVAKKTTLDFIALGIFLSLLLSNHFKRQRQIMGSSKYEWFFSLIIVMLLITPLLTFIFLDVTHKWLPAGLDFDIFLISSFLLILLELALAFIPGKKLEYPLTE